MNRVVTKGELVYNIYRAAWKRHSPTGAYAEPRWKDLKPWKKRAWETIARMLEEDFTWHKQAS